MAVSLLNKNVFDKLVKNFKRGKSSHKIPSKASRKTEMVGRKKSQFLINREETMNGDSDDEFDKESETEEEEEEEEEEDEMLMSGPSKNAIYNREGLLEKLNDISWPEDLEWTHKLSIDFDQEQEIDANDDLARELAFFTQALEGTKQAFEKLRSMGKPFLRPPDYYAEMVKNDKHMVKIKGRLLFEKKKMEEAEERRKAREAKRIAKEVQSQKLKERAKQKKEEIESVKKWRKQRQKNGFEGGNEGLDFEDRDGFARGKKMRPGVSPGDRSGGLGQRHFKGKKGGKGKKIREQRDSKFGYGGRKGLRKQNMAETTNDLRGFNAGNSQKNKKRKR